MSDLLKRALVQRFPKAHLHGVHLVCPEDRVPLLETLSRGKVRCPNCLRQYFAHGVVWDLRPDPDALAMAEDAVHAEPGELTWRRLVLDKAERIREFERRWLGSCLGGDRFLELGAGLAYASALVKFASPGTVVVTTDISPHYLDTHARAVAGFMGATVDLWAAADARRLPFADGQFDRVWSAMLLYRLPDPAEAVREIRRVLAPGGRWIGLEPAAPWAWPWSAREARRMAALNRERGTRETPRSMRFWRRLAQAEGLAIRVPLGSRVPWPWMRWILNSVWTLHVWLELRKEER